MNRRDRILVENFHYAESLIYGLLRILPPFVRRIFYKLTFKSFGKNIHVGEGCLFVYPWKIRVGDDSSIGGFSQFIPSLQFREAEIILGRNVLTGPNIVIYGAGHPIANPQEEHIGKSVIIHDNVYIGGNVVIRYGVQIGESAVVAAGSVVTKDVPAFTVVGGNPARHITDVPRMN